jgi:hypothetical protein
MRPQKITIGLLARVADALLLGRGASLQTLDGVA